MKILLVAASLLLIAPCYARLGETKDQCVKRYAPTPKGQSKVGHPTSKLYFLSESFKSFDSYSIKNASERYKKYPQLEFNGFSLREEEIKRVEVVYLKGKVVCINYGLADSAIMTEEIFSHFLVLNAQGFKWGSVPKPFEFSSHKLAWRTYNLFTDCPYGCLR